MNYEKYIKEIVGSDAFYKGKNYNLNYVDLRDTYTKNDYTKFYFEVESERTYNCYDVMISIDTKYNKIQEYSCDCPQFYMTDSCKHIAASLICYQDDIFNSNPKSINELILSEFKSQNNKVIKQELKFDLYLEFYNQQLNWYFKFGPEKTYVVNINTKYDKFVDSFFNNNTYTISKNFTYDPNIHYFNDTDLKILNFLCTCEETRNYYSYYERSNPFNIKSREAKALFNLLKNKSFYVNNNLVNNIVYGIPTKFNLDFVEDKYVVNIKDYQNYIFLDEKGQYICYDKTLYIVDNLDYQKYFNLLNKFKVDKIELEKENLEEFKEGLLSKISNDTIVSNNVTDIVIAPKPKAQLYFDIDNEKIICNCKFKYNNIVINYFENNKEVVRDNKYEQNVISDLEKLNFIQVKNKFVITEFDDVVSFLEKDIFDLKEKYEIYTSKKIDSTKIVSNTSSNSNFSIGKDNILSYDFAIDNIDKDEISRIIADLRNNKKYYKMKNGDVLKLEDNEGLNEFNDLIANLDINPNKLNEKIEIPKYRSLYIKELQSNKYGSISTNKAFDTFINNFQKYKSSKVEFESDEENILRDYQKEGVKWLYTIYKCNFGGILADEMGLGKSIQTISFIKKVLKDNNDAKILIVVPTALVYNWQKEFEKFGNNLKYLIMFDNKEKRKKLMDMFDDYNIFITSYGLVRNDNEFYSNKTFEICIIDEAQSIKNYQSDIAKSIKNIKANNRIALTGTPLENSITELWSIFDFIMPGYLSSILKFKSKYNVKDVGEKDLDILKDLNYQIKPFILRRKKSDVTKDLPDKIENNIYLEFGDKQKALYLSLLEKTNQEIDNLIENEGYNNSKFRILQLLTTLREVCVEPSLVYQGCNESVKIEKLLEIVRSYINEGHKILIFSSFKRVLNDVKKMFDKEMISNYMINGDVKSKDRMNLVESFNQDKTNCFLITLKAGGTGLNLTGADVVIHLDIWWNPQVENQATDRAHRIGQKNNVLVIKLIIKGTIEEKILELQEKKKILSDNLIEGTEQTLLSSLSKDELKKLLIYND